MSQANRLRTIAASLIAMAAGVTDIAAELDPGEVVPARKEGITQIGIPWVNQVSSELWYLNLCRQSSPWFAVTLKKDAAELADDLDENGYFVRMPKGETHVATQFSLSRMHANELGEYILEWDGETRPEDVYLADEGAEQTSFETINGRNVLKMRVKALKPIRIVFKRIVEGHHPRNMDWYRNDPEWLARRLEGFTFTGKVVRALRDMRADLLRFMDAERTNNNKIVYSWERPHAAQFSYNDGMPLEAMLALSEEVEAMPQFQIPARAADEYTATRALDIYRLYGDRPFNMAYSNETRNFGFDQAHWIKRKAILEWGQRDRAELDGNILISTNPIWGGKGVINAPILIDDGDDEDDDGDCKVKSVTESGGQYTVTLSRTFAEGGPVDVVLGGWWDNSMHAKMSCHHARVFMEAWPGDPANVRWIMEGWQASVNSSEERMLGHQWKELDPEGWVDPRTLHHRLDITAYFGHGIAVDKTVEMDWLFGPDGLARGYLDDDADWWDRHSAMAFAALRDYLIDKGSRHGLERWCRKITMDHQNIKGLEDFPIGYYENGPHMAGGPRWADALYMKKIKFLSAFQSTEYFADVAAAHFDMVRELGVKRFTIFRLFSQVDPETGLYDFSYQDHIDEKTPAVRVLQERVAAAEPWWH